MSNVSGSEIIRGKPIGKGLNAFRDSFKSVCVELDISESLNRVHQIGNGDVRDLVLNLILALQTLPASRLLPSSTGQGTLLGDLSRFALVVDSGDFALQGIIPLLTAVLSNKADEVVWKNVYAAVTESTSPSQSLLFHNQTSHLYTTSSIADSSEHREYMDDALKEELGPLRVGVPGFYKAFFGEVEGLEAAATAVFVKCKEGDRPLYSEENDWRDWPKDAKEKEVLKWFAEQISLFLDLAEQQGLIPRTRRRTLAQPDQQLQGSTAERKLDIGFVNNPKASEDYKCHWSQILVPGELKCNRDLDAVSKTWRDLGRYAREVFIAQDTRRFVLSFTLCGSIMRLWEFDRLGGIASLPFDINKNGLQFVSVVLGYLWMNEKRLGFDPTILESDGKRYVEIVREDHVERLILDGLMNRAPCVVGRATTCWKAHREGDESKVPLVIKDSWQYPEREEEGGLLRQATEKGVVNVARYYYHETVRIDGKDDDVRDNIRKGLDVTRAVNYKPEGCMLPSSATEMEDSTRSSRNISKKRSYSSTEAPLPPTKRIRLGSPTEGGGSPAIQNRVHRRVIIRDYGKALYKASSRAAMLAALEGCIEGYESLHTQAGMLHRDVSIGNLMMNEEDSNPSWRSFLIDLDLAIKEQREGLLGAQSKTGTRAFMAIGALYDEKRSFMHDLESFFWVLFWVLFWVCIHYNGPHKASRIVPGFEKWNYMDTKELAGIKKGEVSDEGDFLKDAEENFTSYHQPLLPWVNRLRKVVFPGGTRWKEKDMRLYSRMKEIIREAQRDPTVLEECIN